MIAHTAANLTATKPLIGETRDYHRFIDLGYRRYRAVRVLIAKNAGVWVTRTGSSQFEVVCIDELHAGIENLWITYDPTRIMGAKN